MMIPADKVLPQDKVDVLDHDTGDIMRVHVSDANYMLAVEPERYEVVKLEPDND